MFGKIFKKADAKSEFQGVISAPPPWVPEFAVTAMGAKAYLRRLMIHVLTKEKGIHAETLMTSLGALVGFAAQHAVLETYVKTGKLPLHGVGKDYDGGAFVILQAGNPSQTYYFGDLLNSFLVPTSSGNSKLGPDHNFTLFALLGGAATLCGVPALTREEVGPIFGHAAQSAGSPGFGAYRMGPEHKPAMSPREALDYFWPGALYVLGLKPPVNDLPILPAIHWPVLLGILTQEFIVETKDVLSPTVSARLVMEAAIPMSKVDLAGVPKGDPTAG